MNARFGKIGAFLMSVLLFAGLYANTQASANAPLPQAGKLILLPQQPETVTQTNSDSTLVAVDYSVDPQTLDPALDFESAGYRVNLQVYEPLVFLDREHMDRWIPMLATDWQISPDGLVYTFHVRQGVQFHNGNALTPGDVAYSFQRALLQGGSRSPQWMFAEAFLGSGFSDIVELIDISLLDDRENLLLVDPAVLLEVCQSVKDMIVADDESGTVTMTLAQPFNPFLATVSQWGFIMDQDWVIDNGGWDGSCSTWQNYYAMQPDEDPFTAITNGTGPFMLEYWTPGVEISLLRNPAYWRTEPMWEDGPSDQAALGRVVLKLVSDVGVRASMLLSGEADIANINSATSFSTLDSQVLLEYQPPEGITETLVQPDGTLKLYPDNMTASASHALFNYGIATGGPTNYVGSGTLDGEGIPPDFFTDIHVRKAFNYAFNWTEYINQTSFLGRSCQSRGPIIPGLIGYSDSQPTYSYVPTLAMQEFEQAWGGQVIQNGFAMTITYNEGNLTRQYFAEILGAGIEALDPDFKVNVVSLPWSSYLEDQRAERMSIFNSGWLQDMPHPYNWLQPFLLGVFAFRQNLPEQMQSVYAAKINTCLALTGEDAQACYEDIQNTTYLDAVDIFLTHPSVNQYLRAEVRGYYYNPSYMNAPYFYALSKGPLPVVESVTPETEAIIDFTSSTNATGSLLIPVDALSQPLELMITSDIITGAAPANFLLGDLAFDIQAFVDGVPLDSITFDVPAILTLHYEDQNIGVIIEDELRLFWWDGTAWVEAACGEYVRDMLNNVLQVPICHLSEFAIGGPTHKLFLPLLER